MDCFTHPFSREGEVTISGHEQILGRKAFLLSDWPPWLCARPQLVRVRGHRHGAAVFLGHRWVKRVISWFDGIFGSTPSLVRERTFRDIRGRGLD